MVMFFWGADLFFRLVASAGRLDGDLRRRQAVDVEGAASRRACARSTRCTCPSAATSRSRWARRTCIHDYSIPAFRVKMDAVPGKLTTMWFKAEVPGTYHLFCAEFCGTKHSGMIGQVIAMEPQRLRGVAGGRHGRRGGAAGAGRREALHRAGVHHVPQARTARRASARTLAGVFGVEVPLADGRSVMADDNYLRESIMVPTAKVRAGLPARDAAVPGAGELKSSCSSSSPTSRR